MRIRTTLAVSLLALLPISMQAGMTQRTTYSFENRFPNAGHTEGGLEINFEDIEVFNDGVVRQDYRRTSYGAYARYGLLDNLTASAAVPVVFSDPDPGGSEFGLGDLRFGLQLKAYEDIFDYPFVIPHIEVSLPTGEEDSGTGDGEMVLSYGVSIGTVTWDWLTWILDIRYEAHDEIDDVIGGSLSLIAEVSREFSVIAEARATDEPSARNSDYSASILGGLAYNWSKRFTTVFAAGGAIDDGDDFQSVIRAGYTW